MTNSYGTVLTDNTGKGPAVRLAQKIGDFDMLATVKAVKEAAVAATQKQADKLKRNEEVVLPAVNKLEQSLKELENLALSLSNDFRASASSGMQNAFRDLQAYVSMQNGVNPGQYVDVTVDNILAKSTASQAIRIAQIAKADVRVSTNTVQNSSSANITDVTTALGLAGSFKINEVEITVAAENSLIDIINLINSANANVKADYIQDGNTDNENGNFYLVLSHRELATPFTFEDNDGILEGKLGIDVTTPTDVKNLQAKIEIDFSDSTGVVTTKTMYYDSNAVDNLIAGTTLNLKNTTSEPVNIRLAENATGLMERITAFFQQYNNIREIINRNSLRDKDGNLLDKEATMPDSTLIQRLGNKLEMMFSAMNLTAADGDYTAWKDIGISKIFKGKDDFSSGTYTIDAAKLGKAIASNFKGVEKLFANTFTSSNSNFKVNISSNNTLSSVIANKNITVNYARTAYGYEARLRYVNAEAGISEDTGVFQLNDASQIVGPEGSVFAGLTITTYAHFEEGQSSEFTVNAGQGLIAGIRRSLAQLLDKKTGEFQAEAERIKSQNNNFKKQIESAEARAKRIEEQWSANTARLYKERDRYEQFSKFLSNMYKAMNAN